MRRSALFVALAVSVAACGGGNDGTADALVACQTLTESAGAPYARFKTARDHLTAAQAHDRGKELSNSFGGGHDTSPDQVPEAQRELDAARAAMLDVLSQARASSAKAAKEDAKWDDLNRGMTAIYQNWQSDTAGTAETSATVSAECAKAEA